MSAFARAANPQPLAGLRVVITRSSDRSATMAQRLRELGATPIFYPTISFAAPEDPEPLDAALRRLLNGQYDWLALTSVTAVQFVAERLRQISSDGVIPARIAAVGPSTAEVCLELLGVAAAVIPEKFDGSGLITKLGDMREQRVLLANADIARPVLAAGLREAGALIDRVIAYRTVAAGDSDDIDMPALLADGGVDVITFTSGSTARGFVERIGPAGLEHARTLTIACIGPATAQAAQAAGLPPTVVAGVFTEEGLIAALVDALQDSASTRV
jgi:uroporphyrinogen-III synthase